MRNFTISLIVLGFIGFCGYIAYPVIFPLTVISTPITEKNESANTVTKESNQEPEEVKTITFDEKPAKTNAKYFEKVIKLKGEYMYFASPITITKATPPTLIIYSHGSNTTVSKNMNDPFMKDMQLYGEYFTKRGFAFVASSMHGANWGNDLSVSDMKNAIDWVSTNYMISKKVDVLGFSMGGLASFNFLFKYPKLVERAALLAPTSREYSSAQFLSIRKIPIKIWHGNKDVNVPLSLSQSLVSRNLALTGFTNIVLEIQPNKGHFDIDTELRKNIYTFFADAE